MSDIKQIAGGVFLGGAGLAVTWFIIIPVILFIILALIVCAAMVPGWLWGLLCCVGAILNTVGTKKEK